MNPDDSATPAPPVDKHRRRAAYLYGLIVTGAVLASSGDSTNLSFVAGALLGTLLIYWAAETYVHWMAARLVHERDLTAEERRQILADGWPLVTACTIPLVLLLVEAALGLETGPAIRLALAVNAVLLVLVGHAMGRASGLHGWRLTVSVAAAGLLGLAVIALKTLLH